MAILAFDTTTDQCSVACLHDGKTACQAKSTRSGRGAPADQSMAAVLVPMLQECLAESGVGFAEVQTLMLPRGPGSFTGIRIGFSVMHGLAASYEYQVIAPTVFDVWANTYSGYRILMLMDNKQGRFYAATAANGVVYYDNAGIISMSEVERLVSDFDLVISDQELPGAEVPDIALAVQMLSLADKLRAHNSNTVEPYYLHNPAFKKL